MKPPFLRRKPLLAVSFLVLQEQMEAKLKRSGGAGVEQQLEQHKQANVQAMQALKDLAAQK